MLTDPEPRFIAVILFIINFPKIAAYRIVLIMPADLMVVTEPVPPKALVAATERAITAKPVLLVLMIADLVPSAAMLLVTELKPV